MYTIYARNANDALSAGINYLLQHGIAEDSRNGPVLVAPGPVCTVYAFPRERVLFSATRDANPFFHLIGDALWCLSGSNSIEWPSYFNSRYGDYSDDGHSQHGAYGSRWQSHFYLREHDKGRTGSRYDQLNEIVRELLEKPGSRQAVLTMWDPSVDLRHVGKDVPCNTQVYFDARGGKINMTVLNRSNDIIWGCYGANVVQFSILQEYVADALGLPVGVYRQFSNNFHVYTDVHDRVKLETIALEAYSDADTYNEFPGFDEETTPLIDQDQKSAWRTDLSFFMREGHQRLVAQKYNNSFFNDVAEPMFVAWALHKRKDYVSALSAADNIAAPDWRVACTDWLNRRKAKLEVRDGQL